MASWNLFGNELGAATLGTVRHVLTGPKQNPVCKRFQLARFGQRDAQQFPALGQSLFLGTVGQQAVMLDAHEPARQRVFEKTTDKLLG